MARKFGLPAGSVYWHIRHHISPEYRASITAGPFSSEEQLKKLVSENESSVLDTLKALNSGVLTKWLAAFESDALDGFINLTASARKNLELMAKLNHEIAPPGPTSVVTNNNTIVSIHQSPEYLQTISTLAIALRAFPEARQAVAAALKGIGGLPHQQRPAAHRCAAGTVARARGRRRRTHCVSRTSSGPCPHTAGRPALRSR